MTAAKTLTLLAFSCLLASSSVFAGAAEIKARMKARIPQLSSLKKSQAIGESNKGLLEQMPGKSLASADKAAVDGENTDRKTIYAAIAQKTGASVAEVGKRRAITIAESAKPGTKIQAADGSWKTK